MIDIIICGINSKNGQSLYKCATESNEVNVVCGVDDETIGEFKCPVYKDIDQVKHDVDVVIDFSEDKIKTVINFALKHKCAVVLGTLLTDEIKETVLDASKEIPIFVSSNFSIAVNLLLKFVCETAKQFGAYDVEILDISNRDKTYSPSATSELFADSLIKIKHNSKVVNGRRKGKDKRNENEIGIHSIRGGNLLGSHKIMFIGADETISFEHVAECSDLYGKGAIKASQYILSKQNGLYQMTDYLKDQIK